MTPEEMAAWLERERLLAILRLGGEEAALPIVEQLVEGGVRAVEFSLVMPGALSALTRCVNEFGDSVRFGTGTVLSEADASASVDAGAAFLVSPNLDPVVLARAQALGVLHVPGALTPTEVATAMGLGAQLIKLFPARALGSRYLGDLLGPFPGARLLPTGGINADNATEFLAAGAVAVGASGSLIASSATEAPPDLSERVRRMVDATRRTGATS